MPVLVDSGPGLGESLTRGFDSFLKSRRAQQLFEQDLADRMYQRKRQEIADNQSGIHILRPGEALPFDVSQGLARQDAATAARALPSSLPGFNDPLVQQAGAPTASVPSGGMPPLAAPIPSRAAAGRSNIPGQGSFMDRLSAMVGAPQHGPRYERGNGYYIDNQPRFDREDAARNQKLADQFEQQMVAQMLAEQERGRKAGVYAGAGVAPDRASLYAENPALAANDPLFMRPTPTLPRNVDPLSPEGIKAAAERARQVAAAEAPYRRDPNASPPPRPVQPTEFSNKAALVYPRAEQAAKILDEFFTNGAPAESVLGHVPFAGNYLQSDASQRMNQAAETVASAILRLESGAAISQDEIKRYARQFLPEPGDGADVRAQKRATLMTQLQRLRAAAGPSMGQPGVVPVPTGDTTANPWRTP